SNDNSSSVGAETGDTNTTNSNDESSDSNSGDGDPSGDGDGDPSGDGDGDPSGDGDGDPSGDGDGDGVKFDLGTPGDAGDTGGELPGPGSCRPSEIYGASGGFPAFQDPAYAAFLDRKVAIVTHNNWDGPPIDYSL